MAKRGVDSDSEIMKLLKTMRSMSPDEQAEAFYMICKITLESLAHTPNWEAGDYDMLTSVVTDMRAGRTGSHRAELAEMIRALAAGEAPREAGLDADVWGFINDLNI